MTQYCLINKSSHLRFDGQAECASLLSLLLKMIMMMVIMIVMMFVCLLMFSLSQSFMNLLWHHDDFDS